MGLDGGDGFERVGCLGIFVDAEEVGEAIQVFDGRFVAAFRLERGGQDFGGDLGCQGYHAEPFGEGDRLGVYFEGLAGEKSAVVGKIGGEEGMELEMTVQGFGCGDEGHLTNGLAVLEPDRP